jgi:integrase/recombinase XerD
MYKPKEYLFEGMSGGQYSIRSVQQVFELAKQKTGNTKREANTVCATALPLLDKGTDIRYIKDLLRHFDIKTTRRYLPVRKEELVKIESNLDDLWRKGGIER